ncbi:MAG: hypothetical protein F4X34_04580 [Chloroflexi bacterium]|nr:hypothetical protein [Chloroflexota bacterium]
MRFLIDNSAGRQIADWLRGEGHDVIEMRELGPDPGDRAILDLSVRDNRVLVTIDTDFGELVFSHGLRHAGLVRLPDSRIPQRIYLMSMVIARHQRELEMLAIITVSRGGTIRITQHP